MNIRDKRFLIDDREIISQEPSAAANILSEELEDRLARFLLLLLDIEHVTGVRWRCTSFLRNSPSHRLGQAIDFAPVISTASWSKYGSNIGSDPILYRRKRLIRQLLSLRDNSYMGDNMTGIFIEPDHLHIQELANDGSAHPTKIVLWGVAKPIYKDTYSRQALPYFESLLN